MSLIIPVDSKNSYFTLSVPLDGKIFIFQFKYNTRFKIWYVSLFDSNNNPIVYNVKILPLLPLFSRHRKPNMFSGDVIGINLNDKFIIPTRENLGNDFKLYYFSKDELVRNNLDLIA